MKISRIAVQTKDKNRYSIYVDDAFAFGVSESGLLRLGIRIGQEVSEQDVADFKKFSQSDKLFNQVLSLIMRRPRSEWEIQMYLKRKDRSDSEIAETVERLRDKGYVDDHDFARRWVENRRLLKPTSKRKLQIELRQKRVSDVVIQDTLSNDETDETEVLRQEIARRRRQSRYQDEAKLLQYLARQGYRYEDIKSALARDTG